MEKKNQNFDKVVKNAKRKNRKSMALSILLVLCLVIIGVYFCFTQIFVYKNLKVTNINKSENVYSKAQIEKGLGLKKGMGLYEIDEENLIKNAKYSLPYVKELEIERYWPSTVEIKLSYEKGAFYIKTGKDLYILNGDLKVLQKTDDIEIIESNSLVLLELPNVKRCIEGEALSIDEDVKKCIDDVVSGLKQNNMLENIIRIDLNNKFAINIDHTSKFQIKLGDTSHLETKLVLVKRVVEDKANETVGGVIDVSDENGREAIYRKYN